VLTPLVTFIRDMPLKSEILFHLILASLSLSIKIALRIITGKQFPADDFRRESYEQSDNYLSPAPQALPQAAGSSEGLSDAPHAAGLSDAPQAAGFSDAPHAVPQAEAGASSFFFVHPNKFESAIICTS
jgi:hypothetical protein